MTVQLNLQPGQSLRVVNPPPGYPERADSDGADQWDVVQLFARNRAELQRDFPVAFKAMRPGGTFWVSYPKAGDDLSRNHGWGLLHAAGLTATGEVSIDNEWDAMRFQPSSEVRGSQIPGADMLPVGRGASPVFRVVRAIARPLFNVMFRFDVQGRDQIPDAAYVLICNHLGWMDAVSLLLLFPPEPRIHYLADPTSMMKNRLLWALVRAAGGIVPVDRAQHGNQVLFQHVERCLAQGGVVALFPEGDFGPREGQLLPFKKGFAHFAVDARVPVLPVAEAGMKDLWLSKRLFVRIGAPISTLGKTVDEVHALGERAVAELLPDYREPTGRKPLRRWLTGLF
jgi:1-acyl-sn-glycerol-3-phosphate acyltransferase